MPVLNSDYNPSNIFPLDGKNESGSEQARQEESGKPPSLESSKISKELRQLARKLLIPIEKFEEKQREGPVALANYIEKKIVKYGELPEQAQIDYAQISLLYQKAKSSGEQGLLMPLADGVSGSQASPGLTQATLMKAVRKANLALSQKEGSDIGNSFSLKTGPKDNRVWRHLLVNRTEEGLQLIEWSNKIILSENDPNFLGKGYYGTVQIVYDLAHAKIAALKLAKTDAQFSDDPERADEYAEKAKIAIFNEAMKLVDIHSNAPEEGLQQRPIATISIQSDKEGKPIYGYWGTHYDARSAKFAIENLDFLNIRLNAHQRLTMVLPLFQGLKKLQTPTSERGPIVHGDIKPANIFIRSKNDGTYSLVIGDLGDAKDLRNELKIKERGPGQALGTTSTPGYFTKTDYDRLKNAVSQEEWEKYQMKRDVFALAATAWELLIGDKPYEVDAYMTANTQFGLTQEFLEAFKGIYGDEVGDIFERALAEDPDQRPSIDEFIDAIEQARDMLDPSADSYGLIDP